MPLYSARRPMTARGVDASLEALPDRLRAEPARDVAARFRVRVGEVERDVVVARGSCTVEPPRGAAVTTIVTDPATWRAIDAGAASGIEAFAARRLSVRGSIERALEFETLFDRPDSGGLRYALERVDAAGARLSVLTAGPHDAPALLLLHGLGATKSSWLTVVPALAARWRVVVPDLPGFGASSKPRGAHDAPWFAAYAFALLDALGARDAFVAGNSMGGRIAMEMAMTDPRRIRAIACLAPAAAFTRRPALVLVRLSRPELAWAVSRLPRARVVAGLRALFADPARLEDGWYDAAVDEFLTTWRSPRARTAFAAAARNIYLDQPTGDRGFWTRLARMEPPALFVYGRRDVLITSRFGGRIARTLPAARVETWDDCGHVPQIEHPERTVRALTRFFTETVGDRAATTAMI